MKDKHHIIIYALLLGLIISLIIRSYKINQKISDYNKEISYRDVLIRKYKRQLMAADSAYIVNLFKHDSLKLIRDEKDTVVYNLPTDSILMRWAERFGND